MKVHYFATLVCRKEGKKKQVNIAQVKEILRVANNLTYGLLYAIIRWL